MSVDAKGYEEKPWWPYVLDLQQKIDAGGGGGGSSDFTTATVTINVTYPEDYYTLVISAQPTRKELADSLIIENNTLWCVYEISYAETKQLDLLLYNGQGKIAVLGEVISVSGNATLEGNVVTFTGDFTVNATASEP